MLENVLITAMLIIVYLMAFSALILDATLISALAAIMLTVGMFFVFGMVW